MIAEGSPSAVIQLDVSTTSRRQILDNGAIGSCNVLNQLFLIRIDFERVFCILASEKFGIELCWCWNRLTSHYPRTLKLLHKFEMLHKGMVFTRDFSS